MHTPAKFRIGEWVLDAAACELSNAGEVVKLSPRAVAVLEHLAAERGEVVTLDTLLRAYWARSVTSPNAVQKVATELRHALGTDAIETIAKRGYRLVLEVERPGTHTDAPTTNGSVLAAHHQEALAASPGSIGRGSTRAWRVAALLVTATAAALLAFDRDERYVIRFQDRSAVVLPSVDGSGVTGIDSISKRVVDRIKSSKLEVERVSRVSWPGGEPDSSRFWGTTYALRIEVQQNGDRTLASLGIIPGNDENPSHFEEFEIAGDSEAWRIDDMARHAADDLAVLLDEEQVADMRRWRARSVHAYQLAVKAEPFVAVKSTESLDRAADLYRLALAEDPTFVIPYLNLSQIYAELLTTPNTPAMREQLRLGAQVLLQEAAAAGVDDKTLETLTSRYGTLAAANSFDMEEHARTEVATKPSDFEALNRYGRVLGGARLFAEARRYLELSIAQSRALGVTAWTIGSEANFAAYAESQGDFETAIRLHKRNLEERSDDTALLFALVRLLARVGRYQEAEAYLVRLERLDELWGHSARVWLSILHGVVLPGSSELDAIFADPRTTNAMAGTACFLLGDVSCGARYWREIEPAYAPIFWEYGPTNEIHWPPHVLTDPLYRTVVNELGWGSVYRAHVRKMVAELTPLTGVELTTPVSPDDLADPPAAGSIQVQSDAP